MSLAAIPPELKLEIADLLDPISAFKFATTCKTHWSLCHSLITKHKRLSKEHRKLDAHNAGRLLWNTLKEILLDPSKGWYIQELSLPYHRQTNWHPDDSWPERSLGGVFESIPEEDLALFTAAARKLSDLYPLETQAVSRCCVDGVHDVQEPELISELVKGISEGYDDGIIALLVHHLPMLKVFRATDNEIGGGIFMRVLEQVAIGYGTDRATRMPFQRLETVGVACGSYESTCSLAWALHFNCVPSLRTFAASQIGDSLENESYIYCGNLLPANSCVKKLYMVSSAVDADALSEILRRITALERFTYCYGGGVISDIPNTPKRHLRALAKYQGHSLQQLSLATDYYGSYLDPAEDLKSVSLRGFHQLKQLRCPWKALWPEPSGGRPFKEYADDDDEGEDVGAGQEASEDGFQLKNILPVSLESLILAGRKDDDWWETVRRQLDDAKDALPNLTEAFITDTFSDWEDDEVCDDALEDQGGGV